jgi:L-2-hydroxyglutarate oxidase LhgO
LSASGFDLAIIGAGVVGCAVAREFSRYDLKTVLLEARSDLGDEASKGNSAILSTGSDTPLGTLECALVKRGYERYVAEAPGLAFRSCASARSPLHGTKPRRRLSLRCLRPRVPRGSARSS